MSCCSVSHLLVAAGVVLVYQLISYVRTIINQVPAPISGEQDAVHPKLGTWRPKNADLTEVPIPKAVSAALAKPIEASKLYPFKDCAKILTNHSVDESVDVPYGWGWDSDNVLHIHCNTFFPGATPPMMNYWFKNMCTGQGKYHWYKWWHPVDHVRAWYDDNQIHPNDDKSRGYYGHVKYVYEFVGKELGIPMDFLSIAFQDPHEFGFKTADIRPNDVEIVCFKLGAMNFQADVLKCIHYFYRLPDGSGCLMKSRFWMGEGRIHDSVPFPFRHLLKLVFLSAGVRKLLTPSDQGQRTLTHCGREMSNLTTFLPELYRRCHADE